jgi:hypothetical protein
MEGAKVGPNYDVVYANAWAKIIEIVHFSFRTKTESVWNRLIGAHSKESDINLEGFLS